MAKRKGTWYTPNAAMKQYEEVAVKLERSGWKPRKIDAEHEINYFNNDFKYKKLPEYDLYFAFARELPLWDQRKSKENKRNLADVRENIFKQEKDKAVPALASLNYGRPCRTLYDEIETKFRIQHSTQDFYRRQGVMRIIEKKVT